MVARPSRLAAAMVLLLAVALLATILSVTLVERLVESPEWGLLALLLLVPLTELLILLIAFLSVDSDPCLPPKGELERLVEKKDRGLLLGRSPRMRGTTRRARYAVIGQSTSSDESQMSTPESVLDRLLLLKQRGARS